MGCEGFFYVQATLTALMERLAGDHPHHTLHCLMALKNGNRGRDGRRVDEVTHATRDALVHSIDFDKVAAAQNVLNNVARKPALCAITPHVCKTVAQLEALKCNRAVGH